MADEEGAKAARTDLRKRAQAYTRLFSKENNDAQLVLADLARFCHAADTTHVLVAGVTDPYGSAQLEGRRQVFLRIQQYLHLRPEVVFTEGGWE